MLVLIFVRYRRIFPAGEFLKTCTQVQRRKKKIHILQKRVSWKFYWSQTCTRHRRKHFLGGFPLSRNFHVRTHVNKKERIHGKSRVNVKVESRSTFTFARGLSYIAFMLFTRECSHHKIVPDGASVYT